MVLAAIVVLESDEAGCRTTIYEISARTMLNHHQVRARLCDLRRMGLVRSSLRRRRSLIEPRRFHFLTSHGYRRAAQIVGWITHRK